MLVIRGDQLDFVPASHEDPADPGVFKKVLATKSHLIKGQVQMVNWARMPIGKSFQPHYHEDMQEIFVIIHGKARMSVGGMTCELNPGDMILVEPREIHEMANTGDEETEYLVFGISTESGGRTINVPG